jgi:hypothetical protein
MGYLPPIVATMVLLVVFAFAAKASSEFTSTAASQAGGQRVCTLAPSLLGFRCFARSSFMLS